MVGLYLHIMLLAPFEIPVTACAIPLLIGDIDPTYFWFRDFTFASATVKLFLRIVLTYLSTTHGSLVMTDVLISKANVARTTLNCLKTMTNLKILQKRDKDKQSESGIETDFILKSQKSSKFTKSLLKYRQLSILTTVANQGFYYILPAALFICLVECTVSVYFLIKLNYYLPFVLLLFSVCIVIVVFLVGHAVVPMFGRVTAQSENFVFFLEIGKMLGPQETSVREL